MFYFSEAGISEALSNSKSEYFMYVILPFVVLIIVVPVVLGSIVYKLIQNNRSEK
jgi:hypothetical protein